MNAVVEVACCANWFNPLVHLAAHRLRTDQELACDATVIAAQALRETSVRYHLLVEDIPAIVYTDSSAAA